MSTPELEEVVEVEGLLVGLAGFVQCVGCGTVYQFSQQFDEPHPDEPAELDVPCDECSKAQGKHVVIPVVALCGSQTAILPADDLDNDTLAGGDAGG